METLARPSYESVKVIVEKIHDVFPHISKKEFFDQFNGKINEYYPGYIDESDSNLMRIRNWYGNAIRKFYSNGKIKKEVKTIITQKGNEMDKKINYKGLYLFIINKIHRLPDAEMGRALSEGLGFTGECHTTTFNNLVKDGYEFKKVINGYEVIDELVTIRDEIERLQQKLNDIKNKKYNN